MDLISGKQPPYYSPVYYPNGRLIPRPRRVPVPFFPPASASAVDVQNWLVNVFWLGGRQVPSYKALQICCGHPWDAAEFRGQSPLQLFCLLYTVFGDSIDYYVLESVAEAINEALTREVCIPGQMWPLLASW